MEPLFKLIFHTMSHFLWSSIHGTNVPWRIMLFRKFKLYSTKDDTIKIRITIVVGMNWENFVQPKGTCMWVLWNFKLSGESRNIANCKHDTNSKMFAITWHIPFLHAKPILAHSRLWFTFFFWVQNSGLNAEKKDISHPCFISCIHSFHCQIKYLSLKEFIWSPKGIYKKKLYFFFQS